MIMSVFVLFNSCCINLSYDWNSLLKQSFPYFLKHIKNRYDFSVIKKPFFFIITKQIWSFTNQKNFFLVLKYKSDIFQIKRFYFM